MRTGTPARKRLMIAEENCVSVMNQNDTSRPTFSALINCRSGVRQSWNALSQSVSWAAADVGAASNETATKPKTIAAELSRARNRATHEYVTIDPLVVIYFSLVPGGRRSRG